MPKVGMAPVRRNQLIEAAIASLHDFGYAETTVARIAAHAGVSPGIVHHYFKGKDDLLLATMTRLLGELSIETANSLRAAETPRARLSAIVEANFAPVQYMPQVMTAWLALYGAARHSQPLNRILGIYHRRLHSNLKHTLRRLHGPAKAEQLAIGIAALIDGVWLRAALTDDTGNRHQAIRLIESYIDAQAAAS
jgi:TetR/AcrR family transcriptional regulator, transcriptional repressor of bet genes